jgi:imidazolonepropionase-like amidohydrolase
MRIILLFIALICVSVMNAQQFVIKNVMLFDGEKLIEKTSVLVEDGMISEVGKRIKTKAEVIDGSGKFLMPGMTNSHVHAFMQFNLTEAANAGVLNLLDMHGMETHQSTMQKSSFETTNLARYFYAGSAATAPDGHGTQFGFPSPTLTKAEEAQDFVAARLANGANHIKIIVEPWKATLAHDIVKALIDATHAREKKAVVHISKVTDAYQVLMNDADGLVHVWWDEKMTDAQLTEISEKGSFMIPTVLTSHLTLDNIRKFAPENKFLSNDDITVEVKRAYDAGIPILAGTDPPNANINYGVDLYKEMDLLSKAGIPNIDVLKSATSLPAKHFELDKIGYIKEGYYADLILLNGNPIKDIQDISKIATIWKEGKVVRTASE